MKNILTGIYNLWYFRKVVWNFRWWDYTYNLRLFQESLKYTARELETKGCHGSAKEDAADIRNVIVLLEKVKTDKFVEEAEQQIGYELKGFDFEEAELNGKPVYKLVVKPDTDKEKSREVCRLSDELEENNWNKIWDEIKLKMRRWWD